MVGRLFCCVFAGAGAPLGGAHEKKQDDTGTAALGAVPVFFLRAGAAGYRCGPVLWHNYIGKRKPEGGLFGMGTEHRIQRYGAWLAEREYSPGTIGKYLHDLRRFFRDSGAAEKPGRETVAAWRDNLVRQGYAAASVNAMLAAVNGYQEFCGNPQGKAKPLKCQRRVYCDASRELSRAEYFRLLAAARTAGDKCALLLLQTLCATGIRVSELQYITVEAARRRRAAIRCKGKCREILLPGELCARLLRWCERRRCRSGPVFCGRGGRPLDRVTVWKKTQGPVRTGRGGAGKSIPPQPAAPVRQDLLCAG